MPAINAKQEPRPSPRPEVGSSPFALGMILVLLTLTVYWPVTSYDFVDYDDSDYVFGNATVLQGLSWSGLKWAFTTGHASNWHPLTWLSHQVDVTIFGLKAGAHHLTNLVIHCANAALMFAVWRRLTGANWRSALLAGLFALHPMHVESVAWISERKDVLSTFFGLWSLWFYARYAEASLTSKACTRRWYVGSVLAFAFGLLSKPMLVTLPFVLLLLDYWPLGRIQLLEQRQSYRERFALLLEKSPYLLLALVSCVVTFVVQRKGGAVSSLSGLPFSSRLANAIVSYARYLKGTFWPDDLSVLYPHPGHWSAWQVWGAAAVLVSLSTWTWIGRRRCPAAFVGWWWYVGMLVPVIGLVQVGIQSMADRYMYLPMTGICVALIWMPHEWVTRRVALQRTVFALEVLVVLSCAILTHYQVRVWQNTETLFTRAVQVTHNNYLAHNNLGFYYFKHGRMREAMDSYRASLQINPTYADANNNLGHALAGEKKFVEAIGYYRAGLQSSPDNVEIHNNLGNALAETGDAEGALREYRFVLDREPNHADANNNFGIALAMRGQLTEAIEHFHRALSANPKDAGAHGNLGNALAAQRNWEQAMAEYRAALALSSNDAQTRNNLGNVLAELGRLDEAASNYASALRLHGDNPEAHFNLGCTLLRLHRREEAISHLREALRLRPDYSAARLQLERLQVPP